MFENHKKDDSAFLVIIQKNSRSFLKLSLGIDECKMWKRFQKIFKVKFQGKFKDKIRKFKDKNAFHRDILGLI